MQGTFLQTYNTYNTENIDLINQFENGQKIKS